MKKKGTTRNTWICTEERTLIESPVLSVIERRCQSSEDGRHHRFYLLKSNDWCNIIPITEDGKVVLVRQHRLGNDEQSLEIPGGVKDSGESDPQAAALREMAEETGYVPLPGARCIAIASNFPNPAIQNNTCHSFIVGPVKREKNQKLDPGEMIEVIEVPIEEIPAKVANGEIDHALILNAFLALAFQSPEAQKGLIEKMRGFTRS